MISIISYCKIFCYRTLLVIFTMISISSYCQKFLTHSMWLTLLILHWNYVILSWVTVKNYVAIQANEYRRKNVRKKKWYGPIHMHACTYIHAYVQFVRTDYCTVIKVNLPGMRCYSNRNSDRFLNLCWRWSMLKMKIRLS